MNYIYHRKTILLSRNEGKLKSYESCYDLRAWSHDVSLRDLYLREWIKCNMPICALPISTLNKLLRSMSCRHIGRVAPRCHPECKSKKILESICTSCQAMKECLKNDEKLEHFFHEEELETGHWPCDRCLNALKSIRMFWKVILERIFKITNIPKTEVISKEQLDSSNSVNGVTKIWQKDIIEQAAYVKNLIPSITNNSVPWKHTSSKTEDSEIDTLFSRSDKQSSTYELTDFDSKYKNSKSLCKCQLSKRRITEFAATSTAKLLDTGCDPVNVDENLSILQGRLEIQANEVQELKRENITLKTKLREVFKKNSRRSFHHTTLNPICDANYDLKPLDTSSEENVSTDITGDNKSEVIITVKNYKNEDYKHVCMLQVVHKTNESTENFAVKEIGGKKHGPIDLLTKVQRTFGHIVRKELTIANQEHSCADRQNISVSSKK